MKYPVAVGAEWDALIFGFPYRSGISSRVNQTRYSLFVLSYYVMKIDNCRMLGIAFNTRLGGLVCCPSCTLVLFTYLVFIGYTLLIFSIPLLGIFFVLRLTDHWVFERHKLDPDEHILMAVGWANTQYHDKSHILHKQTNQIHLTHRIRYRIRSVVSGVRFSFVHPLVVLFYSTA